MSEKFPAIVVRQWLDEWNEIDFDPAAFQSRPPEHFLMTSIPARTLRRLSNTYRRSSGNGETGIQRKHDETRSKEIARFVREGYPLSSLSAAKKAASTENLRKPGWLPTAIVVNILDPEMPRSGRDVAREDALQLRAADEWRRGDVIEVGLPASWSDEEWEPSGSYPIEVIDGQHRLWSFIEGDEDLEYDLPVVAFFGLDISWQAYLFWTINIKPKKINASLAYDLYPLLRDQEWLRQGEGLDVYRETRAQELTEILWSSPKSPWFQRINMLGETGVRARMPVTQASFVRSLSESLVRPWNSRSSGIGGLFGGGGGGQGLAWTRAQQGAFLLAIWGELHTAIQTEKPVWAESLDQGDLDLVDLHSGFAGSQTLLAADQGVRALHQAVNDVMWVAAPQLGLGEWKRSSAFDDTSIDAVEEELFSLQNQPFNGVITDFANALASYDWRSSKANLNPDQQLFKQALRGTGGYKLLRDSVFLHLSKSGPLALRSAINKAIEVRM
ncbi:DGQHR domain-containing protein [Curtobacterium sp. SL109]|uniref:DGQHR domain-containing protein n=1 Tax=Curtobacterium sp. SL109 TaxID=2994662 RepID=UPI0022767634|nr:DGQHR domain-containing protein [Curtobacterium sp. SL109]MCY1694862.1 DGQHR domain-containing protein [Curtobacterium sp. SL109]